MMCEECGKRPARMAVTMITSGKATTRRLCPQCAARLQRGDAQSVQTALLSALAGDNPPALTCPCCGRTTEQFLHTGRLGCPACYDAFTPILGQLLMQLDGVSQQEPPQAAPLAENAPAKLAANPRAQQIEQLRGELYQAVSEENYERAAVLRDEIRTLESEAEQP